MRNFDEDEAADSRLEEFCDLYNAIEKRPDAEERMKQAFAALRAIAEDKGEYRSRDDFTSLGEIILAVRKLLQLPDAEWRLGLVRAAVIAARPENTPPELGPKPKKRKDPNPFPYFLNC